MTLKKNLVRYFGEEKFTEGLKEGIGMVGKKLKKHFPHQTGDVNELPDDVSFGK